MTRRRFHAPPEAFTPDGAEVELSIEESRHLREALRLRAGDEAFVFDGEGREFRCVVSETGRRGADRARLAGLAPAEPPCAESPLELTLAVALLKGEKFDWVAQKATELGAARIVPVLTRRADVRPRDEQDALRRVERWRRLALEACKQSGRARIPTITAPVAFSALASASNENVVAARLMFAERDGVGLKAAQALMDARPSSIVALVGPEGGWDMEEIAQARQDGWTIITLGGRVLRAETAAITVTALLQHIFGDVG